MPLRLALFWILWPAHAALFAQSAGSPALADTARDWRSRIHARFDIVHANHLLPPDSVFRYAEYVEKESGKHGYETGNAMAMEMYGNYFLSKKEYSKSFESYKKSTETYKNAGELRRAAEVTNTLAYAQIYLNRTGEAVDNFFRAYDLFVQLKDSSNIAKSCVGIGRALITLQKYDESESFLRRAFDIQKKIGESVYASANRLASKFRLEGKLDSAERYYRIAEQSALAENDSSKYYTASLLSANLSLQRKNYTHAEPILKKCLLFFEKIKDKIAYPDALIGMAHIDNSKGDFKSALNRIELAIQYLGTTFGYRSVSEAYQQKMIALKGLGQYESALEAAKLWKTFADSTRIRENAALVADYSARYQNREQDALIAEQKLQLERESAGRKMLVFFAVSLLLIGGILFFSLRNRDKVKKQQAEYALRLQQAEADKLRELDKLKSDFFANISHELRTPLTLMQGPIDSVTKSAALNEKERSLLNLARQNTQKLLQMIGEILDLTKLESGKLGLEEETVFLYAWINRLVAQFDSHAERLGIRMTFEYNAPQNLNLSFDRKKAETIVVNLLSNALKFTPEGGAVEVKLTDLGQHLVFSVADSGRGIPEADLDRVFERFFRSSGRSENADTEVGGTGIGLALCREYAELMGGSTSAESPAPNASLRSADRPGALFQFVFPKKEVFGVKEAEAVAPEESIAADSVPLAFPASDGGQTVLLVEDNEGLQFYLQSIFADRYKILLASNGLEALRILEHEPVDLIVSDIMMPIMDGIQLLEKLKSEEQYATIPVVMLTARADMQDKLHALQLGVDDYLLKPFVEEELLARVSNLLQNARLRIRDLEENRGALSSPTLLPEEERLWLQELEQIVEAKLGDFNLTAETLADELALSRAQFFRIVKKRTGLTPAQYLDEARFRRARRLLENAKVRSVKAAAYEVGFRDEKHFSREFRQKFGKYPSEYLS